MAVDVSIIYVNYFTSRLIADSLKSVIEKTCGLNYEVIIVDNNTEPDLKEKFSSFVPDSLSVKYVFLKDNIGFGPANNVGALEAEGEMIFLLNPDTLLINNAIKTLYDFLKSTPKAGVCGGNLTDAQGTPVFSFRKILPGPDWEFQELTRHIFTHPLNQRRRFYNYTGRPMKVAYVSGANLMIRTDIYRECKGFPEDIFMYWDDVELCKRVKDLGYKVYSVPEARICHLENKSFDNVNLKNNLKLEFQEKYRHIYLRRNKGRFKANIANRIYHLFLQSRILALKEGNKKEYYKIRKHLFQKFLKETRDR